MLKSCLRLSALLCLLILPLSGCGDSEVNPFEGWWRPADPERTVYLQLSFKGTPSTFSYTEQGDEFTLIAKSFHPDVKIEGNKLVIKTPVGLIAEWTVNGDTLTHINQKDAPPMGFTRLRDFPGSEQAKKTAFKYVAMLEKPVLDSSGAPVFQINLNKEEIVILEKLKDLIDKSSLRLITYTEVFHGSNNQILLLGAASDEVYIFEIDPRFGTLSVRKDHLSTLNIGLSELLGNIELTPLE